jgi:hypothetical protein
MPMIVNVIPATRNSTARMPDITLIIVGSPFVGPATYVLNHPKPRALGIVSAPTPR